MARRVHDIRFHVLGVTLALAGIAVQAQTMPARTGNAYDANRSPWIPYTHNGYIGLNAEPLAEFDAMAARCREAFDGRPMTEVAYAEAAGSWVKRMYAPTSMVFRALKTASGVSPFVGQMEITEVAAARRGDDEDSARALDVAMDENVMRSVRRVNFAYQNNIWTVLGGTALVEVRRDADGPFAVAEKTRLSREAVLELKGPMAVCVGATRY